MFFHAYNRSTALDALSTLHPSIHYILYSVYMYTHVPHGVQPYDLMRYYQYTNNRVYARIKGCVCVCIHSCLASIGTYQFSTQPMSPYSTVSLVKHGEAMPFGGYNLQSVGYQWCTQTKICRLSGIVRSQAFPNQPSQPERHKTFTFETLKEHVCQCIYSHP